MAIKKSTWIKVHLYCGLFTCFYLISLGLSTLILNHQIDLKYDKVTMEWSQAIRVSPTLPPLETAEKVRDELGLMGWLPQWQFKRDSHAFQFEVNHLAKQHRLTVDYLEQEVHVQEIPKGFLAVLHSMHFFNGKIPNAPLILRSFAIYQWLGLLIFLISLLLGLYLWIKFNFRSWEFAAFLLIFVSSIIIMYLL